MAYLSVPKIFRHLTFLHLSSPFIVDNCSHISNLSFAITYSLYIKIRQPFCGVTAAVFCLTDDPEMSADFLCNFLCGDALHIRLTELTLFCVLFKITYCDYFASLPGG